MPTLHRSLVFFSSRCKPPWNALPKAVKTLENQSFCLIPSFLCWVFFSPLLPFILNKGINRFQKNWACRQNEGDQEALEEGGGRKIHSLQENISSQTRVRFFNGYDNKYKMRQCNAGYAGCVTRRRMWVIMWWSEGTMKKGMKDMAMRHYYPSVIGPRMWVRIDGVREEKCILYQNMSTQAHAIILIKLVTGTKGMAMQKHAAIVTGPRMWVRMLGVKEEEDCRDSLTSKIYLHICHSRL